MPHNMVDLPAGPQGGVVWRRPQGRWAPTAPVTAAILDRSATQRRHEPQAGTRKPQSGRTI